MKKILTCLAATMLMINVGHAAKVNGYPEAVDLLSKGKRITIVVDFDKCDITNNHGGKLTGLSILKLPEIVLIRNGQISGREVIPTGDVPEFPELGNIYQTSSFTFDSQNQFHAVIHVQDPITYADKLAPTDINCRLGKGFTVYT